jgi:metal-sulfur cluster biosynthetic enzyme
MTTSTDAEAGKEPAPANVLAAAPSSTPASSPPLAVPAPAAGEEKEYEDFSPLTKESVLESLRPVIDPEIRLSIVDLGLIYDVILSNEGKSCEIKLTLTTPMCPYGPMLLTQVQDVANTLPGVEDARVTLVWEPPWDPRTMASDHAKDKLNIW